MNKFAEIMRLKRVWAALGAVAGVLGQPMVAEALHAMGGVVGS